LSCFCPLITITGVTGTFFSALAKSRMSVSLLTSLVPGAGLDEQLEHPSHPARQAAHEPGAVYQDRRTSAACGFETDPAPTSMRRLMAAEMRR